MKENAAKDGKNMRYGWESDLAEERRRADTSLPGVAYDEKVKDGIRVSRLRVTSAEGEKSIGKPMGKYLTFTFSRDGEKKEREALVGLLAGALADLLPREKERILVVGLGNRAMTADAIGPAVAARVSATAHIASAEPELFASLGCRCLAVIRPGVLAETGLEAAALVHAAAEEFHPDAVLVADALAAADPERLLRTVQLCDTGICPGAGIGNRRAGIDRALLGVPVVAVGVPTVIRAPALGCGEGCDGLLVVPRDLDEAVPATAALIAEAINRAFGILYP